MTTSTERHWTLITNHGASVLLLALHPGITVRELAELLQITERSATRILADLRAAGYVSARREGRRNRYSVNFDAPLRHAVGEAYRVRDLFGGMLDNVDHSDAGDTAPPTGRA